MPNFKEVQKALEQTYGGKDLFIAGVVDTSTEELTLLNHFEGYLAADGRYQIEWFRDNPHKSGGLIYGNNTSGSFISRYQGKDRLDESPTREDDTDMIIAGATGISCGAAFLLRNLQQMDFDPIFGEEIEVVALGEGKLLVKGGSHGHAVEKEILIEDGRIIKIIQLIYPNRMDEPEPDPEAELSDEYLASILTKNGKAPTQERIKEFRKTMRDAYARRRKFGDNDFLKYITTITQHRDSVLFPVEPTFSLWDSK